VLEKLKLFENAGGGSFRYGTQSQSASSVGVLYMAAHCIGYRTLAARGDTGLNHGERRGAGISSRSQWMRLDQSEYALSTEGS